jgi:hypothetical protein
MKLRPWRSAVAVPVSVLALLIAACGGTVVSVDDDGGGVDAGGSEGGGGGGCSTATLAGDRACVPGTARAGTQLSVGVDATEGCLGCFTTFDPCVADVTGTVITLTMTTRTCPPPNAEGCPAICALPGTTCTIPALAAGTYTVVVTGETAHAPRQLVVTDDATPTSCTLAQAGLPPPPLDGARYATSCSTDDDCVVVTAGDLCSPCQCPNVAIAQSATPGYEADYRAALSQCPPQSGITECPGCFTSKAKCITSGTDLTGTCQIVKSD